MAHSSRALYVALASSTVLLLLLAVGPTPSKATTCSSQVQQYLERSCRCSWAMNVPTSGRLVCPDDDAPLITREQFVNPYSLCNILAGLSVPPLLNDETESLTFNKGTCVESLANLCFTDGLEGAASIEEQVLFTDLRNRTLFPTFRPKFCGSCKALSKSLATTVCSSKKCLCTATPITPITRSTTGIVAPPSCDGFITVEKGDDELTVDGEAFDFTFKASKKKAVTVPTPADPACNCVEECDDGGGDNGGRVGSSAASASSDIAAATGGK